MSAMLLVPNHFVVSEANTLAMEAAELELARTIRGRFGSVSIAAFESSLRNDSLQGRFGRDSMPFYPLNVFSHHEGLIRKVVNYCKASVVLPFVLAKHEWAYVFFPSPSAAIVALWAILLGRPYGLYVRGTWLGREGDTSWVWRWVLRHANFIVATGEAFKRRIEVYNHNVENEVPLTHLRVAQLGKEVDRRRLRTKRILFVGRLSKSKGVLDLIKALSIARNERHLDVEIDLVGGASTQEETQVRSLAQSCGIDEYVRLSGHLADPARLKEHYLNADVFAFPSFYPEGFPRVLYEAMMYALPIVTTAMPGIDGFLRDGQNCLYCKARDPWDLAGCLERLVLDPDLAVRLGLAGHQDVTEVFRRFEHGSHAEQVIALAEQTLGVGGSRSALVREG
jgi:glycosyltransferase involved in cell wall biosynthesis